MSKITSLSVKQSNGDFINYPIGAEVVNIKYDNDYPSVKDKILAMERDYSDKAPTEHADPSDIYGLGTSTDYGHVRLSDAFADDNISVINGIAMSQKGINAMFNKYLNFQIINENTLFSSINTGFKSDEDDKTMELIPSYFSVKQEADGNYTLIVENDKVV